MDKHPYDELIETVADKMKQHEDDNLGFGIFEKVDKDLGLSRGTAWDASGWKDYRDFVVFDDVWNPDTPLMRWDLFSARPTQSKQIC